MSLRMSLPSSLLETVDLCLSKTELNWAKVIFGGLTVN